MNILFISRAYPPVTGGIENQNYGIASHLSSISRVTLLSNPYGKKFLPVFFPYALFYTLLFLGKFDAVLLGDGVLSPLGYLSKILYPKKKILCIIHGLDITFARKKSLMGTLYRLINIPCIKALSLLIMVSRHTIQEALKIGIRKEKCIHIPNGVNPKELIETHAREEMEDIIERSVSEKFVILRIGRYVRHKGVEWFIRNVLPLLPENVLFVAAGAVVSNTTVGDENSFPLCEKAVRELHLENRVVLLKNLSWKHIRILYNTADLYVSPNIRVSGSMEGFGINAIEAAVCGRTVIASDLEGLKDAVHEGKNGFLVEPENASAFAKKIIEVLNDTHFKRQFGQIARNYTEEHFSWNGIAKQYLSAIKKIRVE